MRILTRFPLPTWKIWLIVFKISDMNSISLPCFLRYQDPLSLSADAVNNKTGLFAKSSEDADYLLFLEDCFSPGVAIFLRRSSGGPRKVRVNTGGCYDLISAVGAPPDENSMAYLREHKEVLNEIIEKYGGDRITDDEEGARVVAVLPNFGTGQWADCQYTLDMDYVQRHFCELVCDAAKELYRITCEERFGEVLGDDEFSTFSGNEVFFEDYDVCSEMAFPVYTSQDGQPVQRKYLSVDSIGVAKDCFYAMVVTDEGVRDDGGDALLQRIDSKDMTIEQMNEILLCLQMAA